MKYQKYVLLLFVFFPFVAFGKCENLQQCPISGLPTPDPHLTCYSGSPAVAKCTGTTPNIHKCKDNAEATQATPCQCKSTFYRALSGVFNGTTGDTCIACSNAETTGKTCTCAGGNNEPVCKYNITLDLNGGSGTPATSTHCTGTACGCPDKIYTPATADCILPDGNNITAPTGYAFDGWNAKDDGSGDDYGTTNSFNTYPSDGIIYARWKKTIDFNGNGGTPLTSSTNCYHNGNVTAPSSLPNPPSGYSKTGNGEWYPNADGTGTLLTNGTKCDDSTEFYAKWTANTITIVYNGNGGTANSGVTPTTSFSFGDATIKISSHFTKDGYTFDGWKCTTTTSHLVLAGIGGKCNTQQKISGTESIGSITVYSGTITLTAQWAQCLNSANANTWGTNCEITKCSNGYILSGSETNTVCTQCNDGESCDGTRTKIVCIANHYCKKGIIHNCPNNKPYSQTGSKKEEDCIACSAGNYVLSSGACEICPKGWWCIGDGKKRACPAAMTTNCEENATHCGAKDNCFIGGEACDKDSATTLTHKGATDIKACALIPEKSKICDSRGVCYLFPGPNPKHWAGGSPWDS
jgi:hypothetical protein